MADVSANLKDWSTTAASNSPAGGTAVATGLDDNLRELQKVVRQDLAHKGADISSGTTTDIGAVAGKTHTITGTTTITGLGTVSAGIEKTLIFDGALTLTHNATSLILPGAANITTAQGDIAQFVSLGSGNWRCVSYSPATGRAIAQTLTLGTEQASTSGTEIDFTSIPSWVKRITLNLVGVSTNGTDNILVQLGDSGGIENTGYSGTASIQSASPAQAALSAGFNVSIATPAATSVFHGSLVISLQDSSDNTWVAVGSFGRSDGAVLYSVAGSKALSATLTQVRLTTTGGSNTFDAGAVNILYE